MNSSGPNVTDLKVFALESLPNTSVRKMTSIYRGRSSPFSQGVSVWHDTARREAESPRCSRKSCLEE